MPSSEWMRDLEEMDPIEFRAAILRKTDHFPGGVRGLRDMIIDTLNPLVKMEDDNELQFLQAARFLESEPPPPPPLANGFMPANKLSLWGAKPKMGKSLLALYVLACVARGEPIFGDFDVRQGGAVYIGMEDGWNEIAQRLRNLGITDENLPVYISVNRVNYAETANLLKLEERLNALPVPPSLVWIDTARQGIRCKDWDNPAEVTEAFQGLRELAQRTCHIAVNHHNRKADAEDTVDLLSGSNALTGAVDAIYALTKRRRMDNGDIELTLDFEGRGLVGGQMMIRMDTKTYEWRSVTPEEEDEAKRAERQEHLGAQMDQVKNAIRQLGNTATRKRIQGIVGMSDGTMTRLLKTMKDDGIIEQGPKWKDENNPKLAPIYIICDFAYNIDEEEF